MRATATGPFFLSRPVRSFPVIRERSLIALALALAASHARAQAEGTAGAHPAAQESAAVSADVAAALEDGVAAPLPDTSIERFRAPYDVLTERLLGAASRPIRFDWRRTSIGVALLGSQLAELNNFNSRRGGVLLRAPSGGVLIEVGLTHVWTHGTSSSRTLSLTPYRQAGRPSRYELDFGVGIPLAEGVVTAWPSFFPAAELVLSAYGHLRYAVYPGAFSGLGLRRSIAAVFSPALSEREIDNLEDQRLRGMKIDRARYGVVAGLGMDVYFQSGLFFAPRMLVAVPLFSPVNRTQLHTYWDLSLALGMAF